jgi:hypothetical protein
MVPQMWGYRNLELQVLIHLPPKWRRWSWIGLICRQDHGLEVPKNRLRIDLKTLIPFL